LISTYGLPAVLETLSVVVAAERPVEASLLTESPKTRLARSWHEYMRRREPAIPFIEVDSAQLPIFVGNGVAAQRLLDAFQRACLIDSVDYVSPRYSAEETKALSESAERVTNALKQLGRDWPQVRGLYGLLLPVVLLAPARGLAGGTASSIPGVLWAATKPTWSDVDLQEFLIHELVHTTLFLEERRYGFYHDMGLLLENQNLVASAIRQDRRPMDKVFHSIVVATEILLARQKLGTGTAFSGAVHPDSETLRAGARRSVEAARTLDLERLLMPRPIAIIEQCCAYLDLVPAGR